jgi:hypothetical protein
MEHNGAQLLGRTGNSKSLLGAVKTILVLKPLNPSNAELNPICHLVALLGAHPILHVSRIRVHGVDVNYCSQVG